jgi:hypothetical protein
MLYPDSGSPFEDASILRNAVYFSTAQRAYSAREILQQPMGVNQQILAFLVLRAFGEFMTSTEDMVGWLFALNEWQPGNAEYSLFLLLDRIKVGQRDKKRGSDYTEARAVDLLASCDDKKFRNLIHTPSDEELLASGIPDEQVENIKRSMPFKLEGWRRIAERRKEQGRRRVRAFNKLKHHMLAFPTREHDKEEVWLPSRISPDKAWNRVDLERAWLEVSVDEVRRLAGDAIAAQAILHDTLALILVTRYGEKYDAPQWVIRASQTDYLWRR